MIRRIFAALGIGLLCSSSLAEMRITFIDAGQADAALIQIDQASGEPYTIVVDGGDGDSDLENNLPTMLMGDPTIELVVLSHPHRDHVGGLDWLVRDSHYVIQHVWTTGEAHQISDFINFQNAVISRGIAATRPEEITYQATPDTALRVLNNGQEFSGTSGINNDSLVFQIIYEPMPDVRVTALFTGDIEEAQGEMLVNQYGDQLKSDIVKVPHHGSGNLFHDFPSTVAADFAFVSSSGTHRGFMHPQKSALDLYAATAEIFCTCDAAETLLDLTVTVDDMGNISVSPAQPPYFVWERASNGMVQQVVITPSEAINQTVQQSRATGGGAGDPNYRVGGEPEMAQSPITGATTAIPVALPYRIVERGDVSYPGTRRMTFRVELEIQEVPSEPDMCDTALAIWQNGNTQWDEFTVWLYLPGMDTGSFAYVTAEFRPSGLLDFTVSPSALSFTDWQNATIPPGDGCR